MCIRDSAEAASETTSAEASPPGPPPAPPEPDEDEGLESSSMHEPRVETPSPAESPVAVATSEPPKHVSPPEPPVTASPEAPETRPQRALPAMHRQEAARALLDKKDSEARDSFLFSLITDGDLSAAYWFARAIEAQEPAPVPSWLLAALAGSKRLQLNSTALTPGLLSITSTHAPPTDALLQLLAVAAAIPVSYTHLTLPTNREV